LSEINESSIHFPVSAFPVSHCFAQAFFVGKQNLPNFATVTVRPVPRQDGQRRNIAQSEMAGLLRASP
jgi:hypothetical protein